MELRVCKKCGVSKELSLFREHRHTCKKCVDKDCWENNKEYKKAYCSSWRKRNPEYQKTYSAKWRKENEDRVKEYRKQYCENNKDRRRACKKNWDISNRETNAEKRRISVLELKDGYVRNCLAQRGFSAESRNDTMFIDIQRTIIKIKRLCKKQQTSQN